MGCQWVIDAPLNRGQRSLVEHNLAAFHGLDHGGSIIQVCFDELDLVAELAEISQIPGDEAIEHAHPVAATDERFDQMRSNEPGSTGDELQSHEPTSSRQ